MRNPVAIFLVGLVILFSLPQWLGAQWVQAGHPKGGWITALAVSGKNLFASTRKGGIFLSTDNGASWRAVNSGLPKRTDFQCLAVSGTNLFAGTVERGVFLSTDNGASWRAVNSGLPEKCSVWRIVVSGTNLFAVAGRKVASVFLSSDNGASWRSINSGLPMKPLIYCLAVSGMNLFAGTEEGKVWRLPLSDVSLAVNLSNPVLSEQDWARIRKEKRKAVFIPKEIKAVMQEGLVARQGRKDIPFTIFKYLLLPAADSPDNVLLFSPSENVGVFLPNKSPAVESLHVVIFFKAKNADLAYAAKAPTLPTSVHEANLNVFIEFRQTNESGVSKVVREVYVPASFQEDSTTYDPDKENWYSVGYTLRPGKYTVTIAITPTYNLKKIGVGYFEIELPELESYQTALETTPVFFFQKLELMKEPDMFTAVHKNEFIWLRNRVVPNIDNVLSPGEQLRIAYYVLGAKPKGETGIQAKYNIESSYEVQQVDGIVAMKWIPQNYDFAFISPRLPLKQTYMIIDDKGTREGHRDLTAGKYSLVIKVKDKVSGATVEKRAPFEIK